MGCKHFDFALAQKEDSKHCYIYKVLWEEIWASAFARFDILGNIKFDQFIWSFFENFDEINDLMRRAVEETDDNQQMCWFDDKKQE